MRFPQHRFLVGLEHGVPVEHPGGPVFVFILIALAGRLIQGSLAQEVQIGVGSQSVSEGFFECHGTSWTLVGPNASARFGPAQRQVSPFGVFEGSPPAVGFGRAGSRSRGEFYGYWSQGFQRSHQSFVLAETLSDGIYGSFACQSLRPFVIGFHPVFASSEPAAFQPTPLPPQLKAFPVASGLADKWAQLVQRQEQNNKTATEQRAQQALALDKEPPLILTREGARNDSELPAYGEGPRLFSGSSAESVAMSVDEARALRQAELDRANRQAQEYLELSQSAIKCGEKEQARIYLRMAERYASGDLRERVLHLQQDLDDGGK